MTASPRFQRFEGLDVVDPEQFGGPSSEPVGQAPRSAASAGHGGHGVEGARAERLRGVADDLRGDLVHERGGKVPLQATQREDLPLPQRSAPTAQDMIPNLAAPPQGGLGDQRVDQERRDGRRAFVRFERRVETAFLFQPFEARGSQRPLDDDPIEEFDLIADEFRDRSQTVVDLAARGRPPSADDQREGPRKTDDRHARGREPLPVRCADVPRMLTKDGIVGHPSADGHGAPPGRSIHDRHRDPTSLRWQTTLDENDVAILPAKHDRAAVGIQHVDRVFGQSH